MTDVFGVSEKAVEEALSLGITVKVFGDLGIFSVFLVVVIIIVMSVFFTCRVGLSKSKLSVTCH